MATTNKILILEAKLENGIDFDTIVNTYPAWKRAGYMVRHGEKAKFITKIWKPCKRKNKETGKDEKKLYLVNAGFFTKEQCEKIK